MDNERTPGALGSNAGLGLVERLRRWLAERRNSASLRLQMQEELHQLGYTVRDGRLYPPEDSATWNALADAALRRRAQERLMGGIR